MSQKWLKSVDSCAITVRRNPGGYGTNREQFGYLGRYRSPPFLEAISQMATLFATTVASAKPTEKDYKLTDGAGLYLLVRPKPFLAR